MGYVRTDSKPTGKESTIYGLSTYVAQPPQASPAKGIIVMVPDAFGWKFNNNRLLVDTYAASGFRVYLPDFMEGVSAPIWVLPRMERLFSVSSIWDWMCKPYDLFWAVCGMGPFLWWNMIGTSHPRVTGFLEKLKSSPVEEDKGLKVGVAGFCWGGKHVIMLSHQNEAHLIDSVFTAHPSALTLPQDIDNVRKPVSIAVGDKDSWLNHEQIAQVRNTFQRLNREVIGMKSEVVVYPGAAHGFSVRIDVENDKQVEQSQEAEKQAVSWFNKTLE